jgi:hypothetical protein
MVFTFFLNTLSKLRLDSGNLQNSIFSAFALYEPNPTGAIHGIFPLLRAADIRLEKDEKREKKSNHGGHAGYHFHNHYENPNA